MALDAAKKVYIPKDNNFYRNKYHYFFYLMTFFLLNRPMVKPWG
jgi:hypothetical protein